MAALIELTLRGDGRVVVLTAATVRPAFFRLVTVNRLVYADLRGFDVPGRDSPRHQTTALDRLFRRFRRPFSHRRGRRAPPSGHGVSPRPDRSHGLAEWNSPYLTACEIRSLERAMNRALIQRGLALVEEEGQIHSGVVSARGAGLRRRRADYVIRHGIIFELEPLRRDVLLQGACRDVVVEQPDRTTQLLRFLRVAADPRQGRLVLHFAHRLDLGQAWAVPQTEFECRRLFGVRRVAACAGFRLTGLSPIADGCRAVGGIDARCGF
jgi:hypothetical protein